jgi:hypothetical protein
MRLLPAALLIVIGLVHLLPSGGNLLAVQVGPVSLHHLIGALAVIVGVVVFFQRGQKA